MKPYEKHCALSTIFVRTMYMQHKGLYDIFLLFYNNLRFTTVLRHFFTNVCSICHETTCIVLTINVQTTFYVPFEVQHHVIHLTQGWVSYSGGINRWDFSLTFFIIKISHTFYDNKHVMYLIQSILPKIRTFIHDIERDICTNLEKLLNGTNKRRNLDNAEKN